MTVENEKDMVNTQSENIMTIAQSEFTEVIAIIRLHRSCALQSVNTEHVTMCWEIGKYISSHIQSGKWGDKVVEGLADYIHCTDPTAKGFSKRNLYNMVRFYETYSTPQFVEESTHYQLDKILQTPSAQIMPQFVAQIKTPSVAIMQTPSAQMVVEYALSRSMSPTMVAEYKSRLIPSEVLQQTLMAYIEQNKQFGDVRKI